MMRAVIVSQTGGPEVLNLQKCALPVPAQQDVLIRVQAAGVNRADLLMRQGRYGGAGRAPVEPLGLEIAGVVEQIGGAVSRWKVGDRVCALIRHGGYAEYALANGHHCLPIPEGLSFEEAACLPETCMTVWDNVFRRMHLKSGENLLVHGGTSGVGVTAIQLAKAFGAQVFATAGTDEKCQFCEELGAVKCVNYKTQNFEDAFMPFGMDAILDYIGGDYTAKNIRLLRTEGRLCFIASLGGAQTQFNILDVMSKRLTITGSMLAPRDAEFKAVLAAEVEKHVWPLIARGQYKPIINKIFSLSEAAEAHRLMESSAHIGKIILIP